MGGAMTARRNTPTKQQVKRAFIEIVNERGLERLSMSDIARRAGINRGTLYLHYTDKYDLLRKLEDEVLDRLAGILFAPLPEGGVSEPADLVPDDAILEALSYVRGERAFFRALVSPGGDAEFVERIKEMIGRSIFDEIRQSGLRQAGDPEIPVEYVREIVLGGVMAAIRRWLETGAREPTGLIARLISRTRDVALENLLA